MYCDNNLDCAPQKSLIRDNIKGCFILFVCVAIITRMKKNLDKMFKQLGPNNLV